MGPADSWDSRRVVQPEAKYGRESLPKILWAPAAWAAAGPSSLGRAPGAGAPPRALPRARRAGCQASVRLVPRAPDSCSPSNPDALLARDTSPKVQSLLRPCPDPPLLPKWAVTPSARPLGGLGMPWPLGTLGGGLGPDAQCPGLSGGTLPPGEIPTVRWGSPKLGLPRPLTHQELPGHWRHEHQARPRLLSTARGLGEGPRLAGHRASRQVRALLLGDCHPTFGGTLLFPRKAHRDLLPPEHIEFRSD